MPTTTLKTKTTKGGSATKASLTNASAEKSRKMLEQMLAKKLSSSTKVPKTMTIKTGATKKSTATRSASGGNPEDNMSGLSEEARQQVTGNLLRSSPPEKTLSNKWKTTATAAKALTTTPPASNPPEPNSTGITESMTFKCTMIDPPPKGGYRKKGYVKKSSCAMSAKKPMSAKPRPKSAKK